MNRDEAFGYTTKYWFQLGKAEGISRAAEIVLGRAVSWWESSVEVSAEDVRDLAKELDRLAVATELQTSEEHASDQVDEACAILLDGGDKEGV